MFAVAEWITNESDQVPLEVLATFMHNTVQLISDDMYKDVQRILALTDASDEMLAGMDTDMKDNNTWKHNNARLCFTGDATFALGTATVSYSKVQAWTASPPTLFAESEGMIIVASVMQYFVFSIFFVK